MDSNALLQCFEATLSADQSIRQHAESQLRQAQTHIGFLGACLDILSNSQIKSAVKTASAVYFKNRIVRHWNDEFSEQDDQKIDSDEKPIIRDRILSTLVSLEPKLRKQLVPVLNSMIKTDYPKEWPNLVENALQLLYAQNLDAAYTGLLCFAEIASSYRWFTNPERPELNSIIVNHFPVLVQVAETLLKEESIEAGEMTVLVLKTYKYSIHHDLPEPLQTPESFTKWGNIHVGVINKPLPQEVLHLDENERRLHPWVKAKKWAYANLNRLFQRYACKSISSRFEYTQFKNFYVKNFVPQLLSLYFTQIDEWCSKRLWIGEEPLYHLIGFLENSISQSSTWPLIKPHYELLVSHFIFPLLCPSDSTLENFENDPEDYIHTKLDIFDGNNSPDLAAMSLLITLTSKKKKTTLESILQFAFNLLTQYKDPSSQSLEDAKKLEGSLRLIGTLSAHFTNVKSPYYSQMEQFLSSLIIPHFDNPHVFIKARTCEIVSKFSDITFSDDANLGLLYRGILSCFQNDHLPVQLEAALALQSFVKFPQFQEALSTVIVPTMQRLLELSNTIDAEAVSGVMQELVEVFSEQLQPFGVELMSNLVDQFLRLSKELNDAANVNPDDIFGDYADLSDKSMAALGLLNTMITVLLSFESSQEVVFKLEETFLPVIEFVFTNDVEDSFREAGELIENSTFLTRTISPVAWRAFELIVHSLTNYEIATSYLEDLMPALNNFLVYGANEFKNNQSYSNALVQLYKHILSSDECSSDELGYGGEIIQKLILALQNVSEPYIEDILTCTINAVINTEDMTNLFAINMINVVVSSLVYHRILTLTVLHKGNFILPFFKLWFQYIDKFTRVYDMKLSVLGLLSLIGLSSDEIIQLQVSSLVPEFGHKLASLMGKLPNAIQELEKRRKEYDGELADDSAFNYADNWDSEDVDEDTETGAGDDYLNFLAEEARKLKSSGQFDDDDDGDYGDASVVEDALANTILDPVNVFYNFKETALSIQSSDPVKYQQIFSTLNADEQETLQTVIEF